MPTRYLVTNETIDMKSIVNEEDMGSVDSRKKIKTALRNLFLEKWKRRAAIRGERGAIAHVEFLFTKLRF